MVEPEQTPMPAEDERRLVLLHLQGLLSTIGSANDAEDHGYKEDAASMREESCDSIRELAAEHPFLNEVLPDLGRELDSGHVLGFGWADLHRAVETLLADGGPVASAGEAQTPCRLCGGLSDKEYAFQKYGADEGDTHLPTAVGQLALIRDFRPLSNRKRQILQCPECGTYYLYETDYEYLVNGAEDEEFLTKLSREEAMRELEGH